jgi:hypothetical protein
VESRKKKKENENEKGRVEGRKKTVELPHTDVFIATIISAISGERIKFHEIYD